MRWRWRRGFGPLCHPERRETTRRIWARERLLLSPSLSPSGAVQKERRVKIFMISSLCEPEVASESETPCDGHSRQAFGSWPEAP